MTKLLYFVVIVLLIIGCSNQSNDKNYKKNEIEFRNFFAKFHPMQFPITIGIAVQNGDDSNSSKLQLLENIDCNSSDSLFINNCNNVIAFGYNPDTTNYFSLVYYVIGDIRCFRVANFDKSYNKIIDTSLLNLEGYMPATRCLNGSSYLFFDNNFTFRAIDTLRYLDCDDEGEIIGDNEKVVAIDVLEQKLTIDKLGKITVINTKNKIQ